MAICSRTLLLVFVASFGVAVGHVALTFPPARTYDLDFLDNSRTKGPCGMPRGEWCFISAIRNSYQLCYMVVKHGLFH